MRTQKIAKEKRVQVQDDLRSLPKKDMALSMKMFIENIAPEIQDALEKGYSFEEIQALLAKRNVAVKASTIRRYYKAQETFLFQQKEIERAEKRARISAVPASASFVIQPDTPDDEL